MILSASRRTDIPAFFGEWLLSRLRAGSVPVRNPRNPAQESRIALSPETVDCIVFWTKAPAPLLPKLDELDALGYRYVFLFTLNNYGAMIEPGVPPPADRIATFRRLADRIGRDRLVWRYDPVIFTPEMTPERHAECFDRLAGALGRCCCKSVISFVDFYPRCRNALALLGAYDPDDAVKRELAGRFAESAARRGIPVEACAEPLDLAGTGVRPGSCIDRDWLSQVCGRELKLRRASGQRSCCGCAQSVDIGVYGTCRHGCVYCYAARGQQATGKGANQNGVIAPEASMR